MLLTITMILHVRTRRCGMLRVSAPRKSPPHILSLWDLLTLRAADLEELYQRILVNFETCSLWELFILRNWIKDCRRHGPSFVLTGATIVDGNTAKLYNAVDPVACGALHRSRARFAIPHLILGETLSRIGWHPSYNRLIWLRMVPTPTLGRRQGTGSFYPAGCSVLVVWVVRHGLHKKRRMKIFTPSVNFIKNMCPYIWPFIVGFTQDSGGI